MPWPGAYSLGPRGCPRAGDGVTATRARPMRGAPQRSVVAGRGVPGSRRCVRRRPTGRAARRPPRASSARPRGWPAPNADLAGHARRPAARRITAANVAATRPGVALPLPRAGGLLGHRGDDAARDRRPRARPGPEQQRLRARRRGRAASSGSRRYRREERRAERRRASRYGKVFGNTGPRRVRARRADRPRALAHAR